jgi:hypothetical protein
MPNWCVNQVDISGDEAEVARLVEFVKGSEGDFDFAKIVPPPDSKFYAINEGQNDFQCGCKQVWVERDDLPEIVSYTDNDGKDVMRKQGEWCVDGIPVVKEESSNGTIQDDTALMFGGTPICPIHKVKQNSSHPDWWYNWNVSNWGSKWNCGEVWSDRGDDDSKIDGSVSYNFDTAWAPAEPVIAALAKQFPTLAIAHRYCEGGMGFAGEIVYENGEVVSVSDYNADDLPDEAWHKGEDDEIEYGERDYDAVPMNEFEKFCDKHFGGVVGG